MLDQSNFRIRVVTTPGKSQDCCHDMLDGSLLEPWIVLAFCLLGAVTTLAGSISGYADGIGTMAMMSTTYELGWDAVSSTIYFCDFNNRFLRKVSVATGLVSTVLGSGYAGENDGTGTIVTLNQPYDVVSVGGSLYFTGSATVRKVTFSAGTGRRKAHRQHFLTSTSNLTRSLCSHGVDYDRQSPLPRLQRWRRDELMVL